MRYKKLTLENFRSFEGKHEILLPQAKKLVIVHAINGTGKSALLHAMNYVLYGKARNPKSLTGAYFATTQLLSIPAYKNKKYFFSVTIELDHEGVEYEISRRTQLKEGVKISDPNLDEFYESILHVKKDGEVLSQIMSQPEIENLMSEAVSRFFLVNREEIQELDTALLDERENELIKREIERSIGVEVLERGKNLLNNIATDFTKDAAKDTDNSKKANDARDKYEGEVERIEKAKKEISKLKDQLTETQDEIKTIEKKQSSMASIEVDAAKKQDLTEELYELEKNKQIKTDQIRNYLIDNWFLPISDIAITAYDEARMVQEDATKIKNNLDNLSTDIKRLERELKSKKCSNCKQEVNTAHLNQTKKKIKEMELQKENFEKEFQEPTTIFPSTQVVEPYIKANLDLLVEMEKQLSMLELDIFTTQNKIDKIDKGFDESLVSEVRKARQRIKDLQDNEVLIKEKLESQEGSLAIFSNRLKALEKDIEKYSSDTKTSTKKSQLAKGIRDLLERAFDSFRDKSRADVAKLAQGYFAKLINTKGFDIELEEDYSVSLIDLKENEVSTPSSGQSGVIAISLIASLARNSVTSAPIIMDSPMASLDEIHTKKVWEFIHNLAGQVILFVYPGEYDDAKHRKIVEKNLSAEFTIQKTGAYNAKFVTGYKPNLLKGSK